MGNISTDLLSCSTQSTEAFRQVMRGCASSVAIVASAENGVPAGIVATAVMSVAMEPPSLMVAINRSSSCHAVFVRRLAFTVNFLSGKQADYASVFHRSSVEDRFSTGGWIFSDGDDTQIPGLPLLTGAQASVSCWADQVIEAHTHTLFLGRVAGVKLGSEVDPLLYCEGQYGRFNSLQSIGRTAQHEVAPEIDEWIDHFSARQQLSCRRL